MRRLTILMALVAMSVPVFTGVADTAPSRQHKNVTLRATGEEYESADLAALSHTDGEQCPPPPVGSVHPRCWTWTAKHLGHGTFVTAEPNITLTTSRGAVLHVTWWVQRGSFRI
jgi:hypothetical protein